MGRNISLEMSPKQEIRVFTVKLSERRFLLSLEGSFALPFVCTGMAVKRNLHNRTEKKADMDFNHCLPYPKPKISFCLLIYSKKMPIPRLMFGKKGKFRSSMLIC